MALRRGLEDYVQNTANEVVDEAEVTAAYITDCIKVMEIVFFGSFNAYGLA